MARHPKTNLSDGEIVEKIESALAIALAVMGADDEDARYRSTYAISTCTRDLIWFLILDQNPEIRSYQLARYFGFLDQTGIKAMWRVAERVTEDERRDLVYAYIHASAVGSEAFVASDYFKKNAGAFRSARHAYTRHHRLSRVRGKQAMIDHINEGADEQAVKNICIFIRASFNWGCSECGSVNTDRCNLVGVLWKIPAEVTCQKCNVVFTTTGGGS